MGGLFLLSFSAFADSPEITCHTNLETKDYGSSSDTQTFKHKVKIKVVKGDDQYTNLSDVTEERRYEDLRVEVKPHPYNPDIYTIALTTGNDYTHPNFRTYTPHDEIKVSKEENRKAVTFSLKYRANYYYMNNVTVKCNLEKLFL